MKYYYKESSLSKRRKGKFPDSNSYQDLVFRFYLKKGGGSGYAAPLTIGSMMYDGSSLVVSSPLSQPAVVETKQRLLNVMYDIRYVGNSSIENFQHQHISAEGVYDTETGSLCLIACREVNISSDCKILVTAQFASLDSKVTQHFQGKIKSLREKGDPLFFETLEIASYEVYIDQVDESIWRMDLESIMALISMMLSCVFIIVQLFHVKKVPEALPAMSITMIVVLALGYMTPLVLNFEALFKNSNKHTVQFSGGGWLELVVRAVIRARGVAAPLNPAYTQGELQHETVVLQMKKTRMHPSNELEPQDHRQRADDKIHLMERKIVVRESQLFLRIRRLSKPKTAMPNPKRCPIPRSPSWNAKTPFVAQTIRVV